MSLRFRAFRSVSAAVAVAVAVVLHPVVASASDADALFKEGREAATHGDYAVACARFTASYALDPAIGTSLNIGDCNDHLGRLVLAMSNYERAIARMAPSDPRNVIAKRQLAQLDKRVGRLTLTLAPGTPKEVRVRIDDVELDPKKLSISQPLDPGRHSIVVVAAGRRDKTVPLVVGEGQQQAIELSPGEELPASSLAAAPPSGSTPSDPANVHAPPPDDAGSSGSSAQRTVGFVVGGVGIAALATGAITGLMATGRASTFRANCTGNTCNQTGYDAAQSGQTLVTVTNIVVGVGLVAATTGAVLVLTSPSRAKQAAPSSRLLRVHELVLSTSGTTVTFAGAF